MAIEFTNDISTILKKINSLDPLKYGQTRNYVNGDVTYLSPYISRGVISTKKVLESVLTRGYKIPEIESFVKELCWRDYFQRVGQIKNLNEDIKQAQLYTSNKEIPKAVVEAQTGISGIDNSIHQLYSTGYMHNHCRMYVASIVCNIAKSHWLHPAQWMYYHLLDGDWASNVCSWQWVAGSNSNKMYYANQENINRFTLTNQSNTFLDSSYEALEKMEIPKSLLQTEKLLLKTTLPETELITVNPNFPTFVYNYYNLDPLWNQDKIGNRVLLLEPDFFNKYPISQKCMDFMMELTQNIPGIQVYKGSFDSLKKQYQLNTIYYKEHPLNIGYHGIEEPRDWISEEVSGYFPSFFAYWKKMEKILSQRATLSLS